MQSEIPRDITPRDTFQLFVTDEVIEHIVDETNRFAAQSILSNKLTKKTSKKHRLSQWTNTTIDEMKKFFGLLLWMGLVKHGSIEEYWSTSPLLRNDVASKVMPRNRFQLLLTCLHFSDNNALDANDRLGKIAPIIEKLQTNFKTHYLPGEILFNGSIIFLFGSNCKFYPFPNQEKSWLWTNR